MRYKIAFIVNGFPSVSETFILNQIVDIISRGHEVRIFALRKGSLKVVHRAFEEMKLADKTTYLTTPPNKITQLTRYAYLGARYFSTLLDNLSIGFLSPRKLRSELNRLHAVDQIGHFLTEFDCDVVHAHFGQRGALVAEWLSINRAKKFRFVVSFHGYDLIPSRIEHYKKQYAKLFRLADVITVNSEYLLGLLMSVDNRLSKVVILREGLITDRYKPQSDLDKNNLECLIVFCGRFVPFKAPDIAVRVMDVLVNHMGLGNVVMRMIGDGEMRPKIEQMIMELSLQDHIQLLGPQSQDRVIEEMNRANVFLLPGIYEEGTGRAEAQGLVVQEAQAIGIPVVVSDAGGTKYGLVNGSTGFVVSSTDVSAYADKIALLIQNDELGKKMGRAGREFVRSKFDTKVLGDQLVALYGQG